jgi:two-component system chemotaxis response regulator CheY
MKVLVVDDSKAMRTILKKMLESLGARVEEPRNGQEGLEKLKPATQIDIVLINWNMPGMSGIEFVRAVRANTHY